MKPGSLVLAFSFLFLVFSSSRAEFNFINYTNANSIAIGGLALEGDTVLWAVGGGAVVRWNLEDGTYKKFTTTDGLANNIVRNVIIDSQSNIWFGTDGGGVSKYDGTTWTTYTTEDGLADNIVLGIAEDSQGNLWFVTWGGGVCKFDGDNWTTYTSEEGLALNLVHSVFEDSEGNIWFGIEGGVSKFDGTTWTTYTTEDGLVNNNVPAIAEDLEGNFWFGTYGGGVSKFDGTNWTAYTTEDGLVGDNVFTIYIDTQGNKWFGTERGVSFFNGEEFINYTAELGSAYEAVCAITEDSQGNLWFGLRMGSQDGGIKKFDGTTWTSYNTDDGLAQNQIHALAVDSEGAIWFATRSWFGWSGWVNKYDGTNWITYTREDVGAYFPNCIAVDKEGNAWFGTEAEGAGKFDGATWTAYTTEDGLANNRVRAVAVDTEDNVWFGTWGGGVSKFDGENWTTYTTDDGLSENKVGAIAVDHQGNIWFGNWNVNKFDGSTWTTYSKDDGLAGNFIRVITVDLEGNLWFATDKSGVSKFDGTTWESYTEADGLIGNKVRSIAVDSTGNVWFGFWWYGGGVSRFDGTTWSSYTTEDGLADNRVMAIETDSEGNLWIATVGGVSMLTADQIPPPFEPAGNIDVPAYMPLNVGDVFTYDDGSRAEITRTVELDWLDNVTAYEKVWTVNPNLHSTDVRYSFIISGDSLFWASFYEIEDDVADPAKFDPPVLMGTANTTPGDTLTTAGIAYDPEEGGYLIFHVVVNRSGPVSVPYGTFEDCITMTFIVVEDGEKEEVMNLILAKGIGIIQGSEMGIASDLAPVHSLTDFQQGTTPKPDEPIDVPAYMPLNIGDVFTYDDGARAEITRTVELDWLDNVTAYEKVWTIIPNPQYTDVRCYFIIRGDSLSLASLHETEGDFADTIKWDPPMLMGTANTTPGDTLTTESIAYDISDYTGMPEVYSLIFKVVVNRSGPVSVPCGTFEDCITMTIILVLVDEGEKFEVMNVILAKGVGIIYGSEPDIATDLAPVHSLTDFQQGVTPSGPKCDFNEDGNITIADVISLLLFQRDNPGNLKADFNQDGMSSIADAISMLLAMRDGTCPDALVQLSGVTDELRAVKMKGLTQEDIEYIEQMMEQMNLTPEQEAAFKLALYGDTGPAALPKAFSLSQNSPNPFNPSTTISYSVPEGNSVHVHLEVYDIRGQLVRTLVDEVKQAGSYNVFWDGTDQAGRRVASGVYLYRMRAGQFVKTRKMVLLK